MTAAAGAGRVDAATAASTAATAWIDTNARCTPLDFGIPHDQAILDWSAGLPDPLPLTPGG